MNQKKSNLIGSRFFSLCLLALKFFAAENIWATEGEHCPSSIAGLSHEVSVSTDESFYIAPDELIKKAREGDFVLGISPAIVNGGAPRDFLMASFTKGGRGIRIVFVDRPWSNPSDWDFVILDITRDDVQPYSREIPEIEALCQGMKDYVTSQAASSPDLLTGLQSVGLAEGPARKSRLRVLPKDHPHFGVY